MKVHWSSSDDILPECNPRGADAKATTDTSKVTCKTCLAIIARGTVRAAPVTLNPAV